MQNDIGILPEIITTDEGLQPLSELIDSIMDLPDESLNDNVINVLIGMIQGAFTNTIREQAVASVMKTFEEKQYSEKEINIIIEALKKEFALLIEKLNPSKYKKVLLDSICEIFIEIFNMARMRIGIYDINLLIKLDEGARVPTYAHNSDAAADLYAAEDVTIPAHSISNMVRTGVHIALPENWAAIIIPRSSIGMKTGLRLSNSQGLIDPMYRGPLGVIYDNISDSDYEIKQGDRIAQMYVVPVYRFKPQIVEQLDETDRNEGGFGSTGK